MSAKDAAVHKDNSGSQSGKSNPGKDLRSMAGQTERSIKGTPSPTLKVPKLPPSPTLSGRLKSPNSEPGRERRPLSVVPRQVSSENSKDSKFAGAANGASRRSDAALKFKEAVSKSAADLKVQISDDSHADKFAFSRADSLRKAKESSPKVFNEVIAAGLEEDSDARRKHKETSSQFPLYSEKRVLAPGKGSTPTLCSDCRAATEGAVCFIGNDGRVSACTTRSAVRLCKNLNCAANNPEYFLALAAPKKYLVSKRHMLKVQPSSKFRGGQPKSPKSDPSSESSCSKADQPDLPRTFNLQADQNQHSKQEVHDTATSNAKADQKATSAFSNGSSAEAIGLNGGKPSKESSGQEEMEDDNLFVYNDSDYRDNGCIYSGSMDSENSGSITSSNGSENGHDKLNERNFQKMRRRSMGVTEKHDPETIRLRKQLIQERKQAEEWMLDYAMEETVQKLAPTGEPKVKILVQAFEKLMTQNDEEEVVNYSDETRSPENHAPLFRSITFKG